MNTRFSTLIQWGCQRIVAALLLLTGLSGCCWITDCVCTEKFDYEVPAFISQSVFVERSYFPTFLNGDYYPNGVDVLYRGPNLFYSMERPDAEGRLVKFYWSPNIPSPFSFGLPPPFNELQIGERIEFTVLVMNRAFPDIDCLSMDPPAARTQLQSTIRTENGELVEGNRFVQLPSVPAGQVRFVKHPIEYVGKGDYELRFIVDFDINDLEIDTTNNQVSVSLRL